MEKTNNLKYQLEYYKKTIALKDQQSRQLLKQLRQTKDLYQNLKHKFLAEEEILKDKVKKLELLAAELKRQNENLVEKMRRSVREKGKHEEQMILVKKDWDSAISQITKNMKNIREENQFFQKQNQQLKDQMNQMKKTEQFLKIEYQNLIKEYSNLEGKLQSEKVKYKKKEQNWKGELEELKNLIGDLQTKEKEKRQKMDRLNELEGQVKNILIEL